MIDELIERVEKGEGADRELEIAVWRQFNDAPANREPLPWLCCYTTSLDAVLALIEEKMPRRARDLLQEALDDMGTRGWDPKVPELPQIARAALVTFLRAHKEQHDGR